MASQFRKRAAIFSFEEARKIARGHGFESKEEFMEYSCPGAYQLPKDPQEVWSRQWRGWDDFLGIVVSFSCGRKLARAMGLPGKEEYMELITSKTIPDDDPASRLPYRPDQFYKKEWSGWDDWLGTNN